MSRSALTLDEDAQSPDLFSDSEILTSPEPQILDESNTTTSPQLSETEPMDDSPEWKGIGMDEIRRGLGVFGYQQHPPIHPSDQHTVLFMLPLTGRGPPRAYPTHRSDKWNDGYVRMPHSSHSLYPIEQPNAPREFRLRWEVIQEKLLQSFLSSAHLEAAILSYNNKYAERWDFRALHHFFADVVEEEEAGYFFTKLLPKIIQLALQLPSLITGAIPLLKQRTNGCISFSQLQVASLLANAFLCTFPRRNSTNPQSEYAAYPYINFNRLFSAYREDRPNRSPAVMEKLKCLFHYFRRVTAKAPEGTITIQRRYIPKEDCPQWDKLDHKLPMLHVTSKGTIETEGAGLLQVDFANKFVGGGVLNWGCVQEEIRFVICPELMVTMLVTEVLDDTEALIVSGIERYSKYEGYSNNFTWAGDFVDETPRDNSGRRRTSVVAIDALSFKQPNTQFSRANIIRELNKAYVGFSSSDISPDDLPAIATGNWGCGAFRGNPKLKVLLQLMAAAVAGRSMVYFTFGDTNLRDNVADMYWHLVQRNMVVAHLFTVLSQYENSSKTMRSDFYNYLYKRSRIKPLTDYFAVSKSSSGTKDSNFNVDEKTDESEKEFVGEPRISSASLARKKEQFEGDEITIMLEKSATTDAEKPVKSEEVNVTDDPIEETRKNVTNGARETEEQKLTSLWDSLKNRETKPIGGSRKSELGPVAKTEKKDTKKEEDSAAEPAANANDSEERNIAEKYTPKEKSPTTPSSKAEGEKKNSTKKKSQPMISDFFPRRIV